MHTLVEAVVSHTHMHVYNVSVMQVLCGSWAVPAVPAGAPAM